MQRRSGGDRGYSLLYEGRRTSRNGRPCDDTGKLPGFHSCHESGRVRCGTVLCHSGKTGQDDGWQAAYGKRRIQRFSGDHVPDPGVSFSAVRRLLRGAGRFRHEGDASGGKGNAGYAVKRAVPDERYHTYTGDQRAASVYDRDGMP